MLTGPSSPVQSTRGHHVKLFKKSSRFQLRSNFFTQRSVNMWNSLPATVVSATNVSLFKQRLQEHWTAIGYGYVQRPGDFYGFMLLISINLIIIT